MNLPVITHCPGTLAPGYNTYSRKCLIKVFDGKKVDHELPFASPGSDPNLEGAFAQNRQVMSIPGVQEKFSLLLDKNKLRLINEGEQGSYILKPIPNAGRRRDQMPANEHLTMQIARQAYGINTAENALIFFADGQPAYITKRFDTNKDGSKIAQDDFASVASRTPQTHGTDYKHQGNYLQLFELLQRFVPAYAIEAPKLLKLIMFNYLFSNGDAHFKNFSLLETPLGDYKLSPAYDLMNSRIHIRDNDFALHDGLLPRNLAQGKIQHQFSLLSDRAGIPKKIFDRMVDEMMSKSDLVERLVYASFLDDTTQRNYWQAYQGRLKQFVKT